MATTTARAPAEYLAWLRESQRKCTRYHRGTKIQPRFRLILMLRDAINTTKLLSIAGVRVARLKRLVASLRTIQRQLERRVPKSAGRVLKNPRMPFCPKGGCGFMHRLRGDVFCCASCTHLMPVAKE
jgi:hypothetical protein